MARRGSFWTAKTRISHYQFEGPASPLEQNTKSRNTWSNRRHVIRQHLSFHWWKLQTSPEAPSWLCAWTEVRPIGGEIQSRCWFWCSHVKTSELFACSFQCFVLIWNIPMFQIQQRVSNMRGFFKSKGRSRVEATFLLIANDPNTIAKVENLTQRTEYIFKPNNVSHIYCL